MNWILIFVCLFFLQGKNDLQTEADRSAQRCIVASLHKQFPNVAIFGEEVKKKNKRKSM